MFFNRVLNLLKSVNSNFFFLKIKYFIKITFLFLFFWFIELCLFGSNISLYWITSFSVYGIFTLLTPFFRAKFSWHQLHTFNWYLILNLWLISICVLCNLYFFSEKYLIGTLSTDGVVGFLSNSSWLCFDIYSFVFVILITTISLYVTIYSTRYLNNELTSKKFYFCLNGFIFGMILLVVANQLFFIILGWELIGWFSFFLISNYNLSAKSQLASNKVLCFNKFSDSGVFVFICIILYLNNDSLVFNGDFWEVLNNSRQKSTNLLSWQIWALIGLISASFVKSAHFGLHLWLPDSMEAPIPASALIHSATLVSAGIYIVGRLQPIISCYPVFLDLILVWGSLTAFIGALVGSYQTDLKKTLAYSTISHCGFLMVLAVNPNQTPLFIYLVVHGLLKSYSFVIGGDIILASNNYQDWRKSGSFFFKSKYKFILLILSVSGLAGLPFGMGFFGKNIFIYTQLLGESSSIYFSNIMLLLASVLGLIYTIRLNLFIFLSPNSGTTSTLTSVKPTQWQNTNLVDVKIQKYYNNKIKYWLVSFYIIFFYIIFLGYSNNLFNLDFLALLHKNIFNSHITLPTYSAISPNNWLVLIYINLYLSIIGFLLFLSKKQLLVSSFFFFFFLFLLNFIWFIFKCFGYILFFCTTIGL